MEIELPDGTILDAPDDADPSAVAKAYLSKQAGPPRSKGNPYSGVFRQLGREIRGLPSALPGAAASTARDYFEGATALAGLPVDALIGAYNFATDSQVPNFSGTVSGALDQAGIPQTQNPVVRAINSGVAGSRVPVPKIGRQPPANFTRPEPQLTPTQQTFQEGREAGFVVPPSTLKPSVLNATVESFGGKAATQQAASRVNQIASNRQIAKGLGLPEDTQLTPQVLSDVRSKAGTVYDEVAKVGDEIVPDGAYLDDLAQIGKPSDELLRDFPDADVGNSEAVSKLVSSLLREKFSTKGALEYMKQLRQQASANLSGVNAADPAKRALGYAQRDAAAALEDMAMRNLAAKGRGDLATKFDEARTLIAKAHSAEAALNESTGNVVARNLGAQLKKGKKLSDEFEQVARFARTFPKAVAETNTSPVSALDALAVLGGGGAAFASENGSLAPYALLFPAMRIAARRGLLSSTVQDSLLPTPPRGPVDPRLLMGGGAGLLSLD